MRGIETVESNGAMYAVIFPADMSLDHEVSFVTGNTDPLQVGIFERKKGYAVLPHQHLPRAADTKHVGEFLLIQKGSADICIYDETWNLLRQITAKAGECVVFLRGGHELRMRESTRILEVKQGPYPGREKDKFFRDPQ